VADGDRPSLIFLGVPPDGEEVARPLAFLVIAIFYTGVWLSLAMLLSIVFRSAATAALVALGVWQMRANLRDEEQRIDRT
jgi:ABC-2 type transport system permease protein